MSKSFYHTISDNQWEIIEPHLPKAKTTGHPSLNLRTVVDAIFWVLDSGAKWRYIPQEFGNWNSICHKFRQWSNNGVFEKILQSLVALSGKKILADKAFCSDEIREYISQKNAISCIPDKSNAVLTHDFDAKLYKARNIIERFFQRIKNFRHIATRYDKLSECFLNFVFLVDVMIQI